MAWLAATDLEQWILENAPDLVQRVRSQILLTRGQTGGASGPGTGALRKQAEEASMDKMLSDAAAEAAVRRQTMAAEAAAERKRNGLGRRLSNYALADAGDPMALIAAYRQSTQPKDAETQTDPALLAQTSPLVNSSARRGGDDSVAADRAGAAAAATTDGEQTALLDGAPRPGSPAAGSAAAAASGATSRIGQWAR